MTDVSGPITIRVFEVVGSAICVAADDGQKVHDQIAAALRQKRTVQLSFLNVGSLTSAFLNAAVGQLYYEFSEDDIRRCLSISDMDQEDLTLLKRVVETAKEYFRDPDRLEQARHEALGDENGD